MKEWRVFGRSDDQIVADDGTTEYLFPLELWLDRLLLRFQDEHSKIEMIWYRPYDRDPESKLDWSCGVTCANGDVQVASSPLHKGQLVRIRSTAMPSANVYMSWQDEDDVDDPYESFTAEQVDKRPSRGASS